MFSFTYRFAAVSFTVKYFPANYFESSSFGSFTSLNYSSIMKLYLSYNSFSYSLSIDLRSLNASRNNFFLFGKWRLGGGEPIWNDSFKIVIFFVIEVVILSILSTERFKSGSWSYVRSSESESKLRFLRFLDVRLLYLL